MMHREQPIGLLGQAVVTNAGADRYLGKYGTKSSRMLYDRLIGEWLASGRQPPPDDEASLTVTSDLPEGFTIAHVHWSGSPCSVP
ncbi:hypothetical protein RRSWK_05097 [Rhodopirellula sp. SWK7]|nr:hypothetical protein RRSWK_05097 [Rhodopirellula sp. SWK7]